jgi:hypothetical protein
MGRRLSLAAQVSKTAAVVMLLAACIVFPANLVWGDGGGGGPGNGGAAPLCPGSYDANGNYLGCQNLAALSVKSSEPTAASN